MAFKRNAYGTPTGSSIDYFCRTEFKNGFEKPPGPMRGHAQRIPAPSSPVFRIYRILLALLSFIAGRRHAPIDILPTPAYCSSVLFVHRIQSVKNERSTCALPILYRDIMYAFYRFGAPYTVGIIIDTFS